MRSSIPILCLFLAGCSSQYKVELWNDTGQELDVAMLAYHGADPTDYRPRTKVAPGGWFRYELDKGQSGRGRAVRIRAENTSTRIDLAGTQIYRARLTLEDDRLIPQPISAGESKRRLQQ